MYKFTTNWRKKHKKQATKTFEIKKNKIKNINKT